MKSFHFIAFLLFFPLNTYAESWVALDKENSYDKDSLVTDGDQVVSWHRKSNAGIKSYRGMRSEYLPYVNAKYMLWAREINCRSRTEKLLSTYILYVDGRKREISPDGTGITYQIVPGSNHEKLFNAVCAKKWYQIWK